jgi:hypothetical protein
VSRETRAGGATTLVSTAGSAKLADKLILAQAALAAIEDAMVKSGLAQTYPYPLASLIPQSIEVTPAMVPKDLQRAATAIEQAVRAFA